jgi:hypothetical protein
VEIKLTHYRLLGWLAARSQKLAAIYKELYSHPLGLPENSLMLLLKQAGSGTS